MAGSARPVTGQDNLVSVPYTADLLGMDRKHLRELCTSGDLPGVRVRDGKWARFLLPGELVRSAASAATVCSLNLREFARDWVASRLAGRRVLIHVPTAEVATALADWCRDRGLTFTALPGEAQ